jgi:tRNA(Met) cytidine acetyltransferase
LPLVGDRAVTAAHARQAVAALPADDVLWVSRTEDGPGTLAPAGLRRQLGRSASAVVLDGHDGLHADVLAACPGFLLAGGTLLLRLPPTPVPPAHLAVHPSRCLHRPPSTHFEDRVRRALSTAPLRDPPTAPPGVHATMGTAEQDALIASLSASVVAPAASLHAVLARRGRGKSTALGRVLGHAHRAGLRVALCAPDPSACAVALAAADAPLLVLSPEAALSHDGDGIDVLAVDEAARLPVPWLRALTRRHPGTLLFATTTGGYEGTGQGFVLRFLTSLADDPRPLAQHRLHRPIRWDADDPLEAWLDEVLLDRATPASLLAAPIASPTFAAIPSSTLTQDDPLAAQVHGLLQHAHYRTTPADLQRLLDAPNLQLHVAREGTQVVAVNLVAVEGGLSEADGRAVRDGRLRVRGHALPETLVSHMGAVAAGSGCWIRSMRLAVHPARRRRGLARALVEHVHAFHLDPLRPHGPVDGFGTLFGAAEHVVGLRASLGYHMVRLGASRGSRTGEPSAVMVRPVTPWAEELVATLSGRTARDLDLLLALLHGEGALDLEPGLIHRIRQALPAPVPLTEAEIIEAVHAYVQGPRPLEAAAAALRAWLPTTDRRGWTALEARLAQDRLFDTRSWTASAHRASLPHPRAAMRALKRACRRLPLPDPSGAPKVDA